MSTRPHILIVGGGYVGLYTALELRKHLSRGKADVTVVDPQPHMTYQPFLPEAAAGSIEARHVVVSLRRTLRTCRVITGSVTSLDHEAKTAVVQPAGGPAESLSYDIVVIAAGSIARTMPIPGLAEVGIGFKTVGEAIYLRDQVLGRLDAAASLTGTDTDTVTRLRRALTFTFIGGGYAGIEALAELEDMARFAIKRYYPSLSQADMRWVLVEASGRILPEVGVEMGAYTVRQLVDRGMDIRLNTRVESLTDGHVVLSDGEQFDCDTVVWTAGVKANPVLGHMGMPLDERGRLVCLATLQVDGVPDAWGAGDCAAVPDLASSVPGATCGPSAQHAVRQARHLGKNLAAVVRGGNPTPYKHKYVGSVASLGLYKGVAQVYGIKLKGFPAWFMHRTYHMSRIPTFNRKVRVVADWTLQLFLRRDLSTLGEVQRPREAFERAAG